MDTHSIPIDFAESGDADLIAMTQYGAYDSQKVYTYADINEIVDHANYRGEKGGGQRETAKI